MRVFIVANNLANRLSDVEISALKRFDALFHNSNFELFFLTLTFNKNIHNIFIKYSDVYNESVVKGGCVNIYFDLLGYPLEFPENTVKLTGKYAFSKRVSATHERYYDEEGRLRMYVVFYEKGLLKDKVDFINYFNKGVRVRREHFSKSGYLTHVQYLDPENNILKDELFDFKGQLKILRGYNDGKVSSIEILNNNGSLERVFYSHEELVRGVCQHSCRV